MEIAIEKKNLQDMDLIKGFRWEVQAIQKELRPLQAAIGSYPMHLDRLTNDIKRLEKKDFTVALDFKVHTTVTDAPESLEIERKRFQEKDFRTQGSESKRNRTRSKCNGHLQARTFFKT